MIRNPVGRWMFPILVGVGQLLVCGALAAIGISQCPQPGACTTVDVEKVVVLAGPLLLLFSLGAWVSWRATVTLTDEGITVQRLLVRQDYQWSDIALVRKVSQGNVRSPALKVQLVFDDGSEEELPAPRAYGAVGARGYHRRAETIRQAWWRHRSTPTNT